MSGVVAGLALVVAAAAAFARYRPARVAIEGISMAPTLLPDDWVLVVFRSYRRSLQRDRRVPQTRHPRAN